MSPIVGVAVGEIVPTWAISFLSLVGFDSLQVVDDRRRRRRCRA
jgi:hypothetical protein